MKFAETVCKPGAYVEVVPAGLLVKLQYNQSGLLEKIYEHRDELEVATQQFNHLKMFVPQTIPLTGGTTWVEGVFYSHEIPEIEGMLCDTVAVNSYYYSKVDLMFYASTVKSYAAAFSSVRTIRNWLSSSGFNILPGMVAALNFDEASIQSMVNLGNYTFEYPYISGFVVFDRTDVEFKPSCFEQLKVKKVIEEYNEIGYVMCDLIGESSSLTVNISDTLKYNIQSGSTVLFSRNDGVEEVLWSKTTSKSMNPSQIRCKWCGNAININLTGPTECSSKHCLSHMYPYAVKMLSKLDLPIISYERYAEAVSDNGITCITDVLLVANKDDVRPKVSLFTALEASIPAEVCPNSSVIKKFVSSCRYSVDTVKYFINNPSRILTELSSNDISVKRLSEWLADPYNSSTVFTILSAVDIVAPEASFDGAPIFRSNTFMLTGTFRRGLQEQIASILKSYSAKVIMDTDPMVCDALIVGSLNEKSSGDAIQKARLRSIAVISEDEFFERYDIDSDIMSNLL